MIGRRGRLRAEGGRVDADGDAERVRTTRPAGFRSRAANEEAQKGERARRGRVVPGVLDEEGTDGRKRDRRSGASQLGSKSLVAAARGSLWGARLRLSPGRYCNNNRIYVWKHRRKAKSCATAEAMTVVKSSIVDSRDVGRACSQSIDAAQSVRFIPSASAASLRVAMLNAGSPCRAAVAVAGTGRSGRSPASTQGVAPRPRDRRP